MRTAPISSKISIDPNSDFTVESGIFFICKIKEIAESADANEDIIRDWGIIRNWLNFTGGDLSKEDLNKIGIAWKAYLSSGTTPASKLQPIFEYYHSEALKNNYKFHKDIPPKEVIDVFDRMLGIDAKTSKEIKSRNHVFPNIPNKQSFIKRLLNKQKKTKRLFIAMSFLWTLWASFRTLFDHELAGFYLEKWDDDIYFANLIIPIFTLSICLWLYEWIMKGE